MPSQPPRSFDVFRMDFFDLRAVICVAEAGSFHKAAKALSIGQSAVSRRVARLEDLPGVSLFERHPRHFLHGPGRAIDVGGAQPGRQEMAAAEDIERQVAVTAVVAVEEAPFLSAVQRIVGGVQIEDDPLGRPLMSLHKQSSTKSPSKAPGSWLILW